MPIFTVVGFTGTQRGMTLAQKLEVKRLLLQLAPDECRHGDCIGADAQFDAICRELNLPRIVHPPKNSAKRAFCNSNSILQPRPYLKRNYDIVKSSTVLIAAPKECVEQLRSGTWSTIRIARRLRRPMWLVFSDGSSVEE